MLVSELKKLEFAGVEIPYSRLSVKGGIRTHVHEYPHVAGGSLEKLGRRLYLVSATCHFDALSLSGRYENAWPDRITLLRRIFEGAETHPLQLPWIGTIDACCTEWDEQLDVKCQSGEGVDLQWTEDQETAFLIDSFLPVDSPAGIPGKLAAFEIEAAKIDPPVEIFETIRDAVNSVLAIRDTAELYQTMINSRVQELINLISEADRTVKQLNDPLNSELLNSLHELWASLQQLAYDLAQQDLLLRTYTTPRQMRVDEIAAAVYGGDGSRAVELMQLNALEDPYAVPTGTEIVYYE